MPSEAGTASVDETGPAEETNSPAPDKVVAAPLAPDAPKPGLTKLADGTAKAVGTLQLREIEGDIWVVVDSAPGPEAAKAKVLVVISDPELFNMPSLNGYYVDRRGHARHGRVHEHGRAADDREHDREGRLRRQ